ncbi:hypothetical protein Pfo_013716 [Paulownia fortunei]|nr:hypothetical protein Pfo_013716 [Paulownia fortunei]
MEREKKKESGEGGGFGGSVKASLPLLIWGDLRCLTLAVRLWAGLGLDSNTGAQNLPGYGGLWPFARKVAADLECVYYGEAVADLKALSLEGILETSLDQWDVQARFLVSRLASVCSSAIFLGEGL